MGSNLNFICSTNEQNRPELLLHRRQCRREAPDMRDTFFEPIAHLRRLDCAILYSAETTNDGVMTSADSPPDCEALRGPN